MVSSFIAGSTLLLGTISFASAEVNKLSRRNQVRRGEEVVFLGQPGFETLSEQEFYASGAAHMNLMNMMSSAVEKMMDPSAPDFGWKKTIPISDFTPCTNGKAGSIVNNTYACNNLDLYSYTPHSNLGSTAKIGNDIWGWTYEDPSTGEKREFGLVCQFDGTAFVEVLKDGKIAYLGRLPTQSVNSIWRDTKVIGHYAYIGSEAVGHGIQVFDLMKLVDTSLHDSPKIWSIESDLTGLYDKLPIGRSHNIVSYPEKDLIVAVGSEPRDDPCGSGLIFVDVSDPSNPTNLGCAGQDGYVHDAQCLTYYGPHIEFVGTPVCYGFDEDTFTIFNITDPANPVIISSSFYYGVSYSHQGWVIDEDDQRYLLLDDEWDEVRKRGWANPGNTTTYIWDIQDLTKPILTGHYLSPQKAIDHNLYVVNGLAYESNYMSGLRVVNVSSVYEDPTGSKFKEIAFFDVHPEDDDIGGKVEFGGAWSAYPYFESGYILVNTMERGLFVLKLVE